MNKTEALAERARLQKMLVAYETGRVIHQGSGERRGVKPREVTPDRADNVRARIAGLDQLIAEIDRA